MLNSIATCWCCTPSQCLLPYVDVTAGKIILYLHMCDPSCSACFSQNVQNISLLPQGTSPPKPPRAHELKLLVKNIAVNLTDHSAAGNVAHAMLLLFKKGWVIVFPFSWNHLEVLGYNLLSEDVRYCCTQKQTKSCLYKMVCFGLFKCLNILIFL